MKRSQIINAYISKFNFKKYLEIGVFDGLNFASINAEYKDAVDPGSEGQLPECVNYKITSDDFFDSIKNSEIKYDFVFIDGLHITDQVDKDIENSLRHLNEGGIIMLHDGNPPNYNSQVVPRIQSIWTGDVWKSVVKLRFKRSDLSIFTINTDYGCVIIQKKESELYKNVSLETALTWDFFSKNKKELLNLISVEDFIKIINE